MPSGTPVRVRWTCRGSRALLFLLFAGCLFVWWRSNSEPWAWSLREELLTSSGTPGPRTLQVFALFGPLGVTLDAFCSHFRPTNSRIDFISDLSLVFRWFWLPFWIVFHEFDTLFALSYTRLIFTLIFIDFTWISTPPIPLKSRFYCSFIVFLNVLAHCTSMSIFTCFVMDSDMFLDAFWHNISTFCQE